MTAALPPTHPSIFELVHKRLRSDGYALTNDLELGLPQQVRDHIHSTYFNKTYLRRYDFDIPGDRERARDVVRYAWTGDDLPTLTEHDTIAIEGRGDQLFLRDFDRVELVADNHFQTWIRTMLALVPTERRQQRGTFGVNLFRTHTQVVTKPHQDQEEYILIYVLERVGTGAESELYRISTNELLHHSRLEPGDLIIFRDSEFKHTATPLVPPPSGAAHRDALVCTVNYRHTYQIPD